MTFPLPRVWQEAGKRFLREFSAAVDSPPTDESSHDHYLDFVNKEFHKKLYEVIGHQYVMTLLRALATDPVSKKANFAPWATKLGVDKTTLWRWKQEHVFAGAEKFFAIQLLILDKPLGELPLPDNHAMLRESVLGTLRYFSRTYGPASTVPLSPGVFEHVLSLMRVMVQSNDSVYCPFEPSLSARHEHALKVLTQHVNRSAPSRTDPVTPVSTVRAWLDSWGMPYTLFALGYRASWKKLGGVP